MDTKALRQKILDLAIRGKLVPQDPNDEPASVLLERIREEKKQMVKDGKLKPKDIKNDTIIFKGEDNLHYEKFQDGTVKCIEDEIPFEVSDGWTWCRLGTICTEIQYGLSNSAESSGSHRLLRITDIQDGHVDWDSVPFTTVEDENKYLLRPNDIVFARTGATVGKSFLISETPYKSVYASYLIRIRLLNEIDAKYVYHFFNSACYWSQITKKSVGVGQPNCNGTALQELFIPLPPSQEQARIAPIANDLLEKTKDIEYAKESLVDILSTAKAKVLDLAIRGKLVSQNSNDEPASVLLERIRSEKEDLIRQGKLKRDKKESIIYKGDDNSYYEKLPDGTVMNITNELPFKIPETWSWSRLSALCIKEIKRGKAPKYVEKSNILVFAQKCNLKKGGIDFTLAQYLDETILSKYDDSEFIKVGDTVINSTGTGTLGRVGFIDSLSELPIVPDSHVTTIRVSTEIDKHYIFVLLKSLQTVLEKSGEGSTNQKELKPHTLQDIYVPIPPKMEQRRICECVKNSYNIIKKIEDSIC